MSQLSYQVKQAPLGRGPRLTMLELKNDVLQLFNAFDWNRKSAVIAAYSEAHGPGAGRYMERTLHRWAAGSVRPTGNSLARLLELVPAILDDSERYGLAKKLYDRNRAALYEQITATVVVGHTTNFIETLQKLSKRLCRKPQKNDLPPSVRASAEWLCNADAAAARAIMVAVEQQESAAIARAGLADTDRLIACIHRADVNVSGLHRIVFPYGTIEITVRKPNFLEKLVHRLTSRTAR